jgi:exopolyphosphatase/guanosine-5'-triphosphate,3'-diphosphate pyrophosphatase
MRQPRRDNLNDSIAVIDIGSNSARLAIYQRESTGQLRVIGNARQPLRLVREVDRGRQLSVEAISVTLRTLADFRSMIRAYNARHIVAVATAAMRDAENCQQVIERARVELGLQIDVIDSHKEAYYGCVGGIRSLPVHDGIAFDLGGGSVQIVEFQNRRPGADCSLPLGSLRLSAAFLRHDPPAKREVRALSNYAVRTLKDACDRRLSPDGVVVGVGGTIRNLAKIDARLHAYPIDRVHGYMLSRERLGEIVDLLCQKRMRSAGRIAGLSRDREDSIVGGAIAIQALVDTFGAHEIVVSGQGVREGLVYSVANEDLPSPQKVREAALISLAGRFGTWNREWAERRRVIASKLFDSLAPRAHPDLKMALEQAAFLLDIGRSVDFFDRFKHAATIVINTELDGFSHRNILLLSTIIANAPHEDAGLPGNAPVLKNSDHREIKRAAILLKIADDMLQHWPKELPAVFECQVGREEVHVSGEGFDGWIPHGIGSRFERLFDRRLVVRSGAVRAAIVEGYGNDHKK